MQPVPVTAARKVNASAVFSEMSKVLNISKTELEPRTLKPSLLKRFWWKTNGLEGAAYCKYNAFSCADPLAEDYLRLKLAQSFFDESASFGKQTPMERIRSLYSELSLNMQSSPCAAIFAGSGLLVRDAQKEMLASINLPLKMRIKKAKWRFDLTVNTLTYSFDIALLSTGVYAYLTTHAKYIAASLPVIPAMAYFASRLFKRVFSDAYPKLLASSVDKMVESFGAPGVLLALASFTKRKDAEVGSIYGFSLAQGESGALIQDANNFVNLAKSQGYITEEGLTEKGAEFIREKYEANIRANLAFIEANREKKFFQNRLLEST